MTTKPEKTTKQSQSPNKSKRACLLIQIEKLLAFLKKINETPAECRQCKTPSQKGANRCHACGSCHDWRRFSTNAATIIGFIAFFMAAAEYYEARRAAQRLQISEANIDIATQVNLPSGSPLNIILRNEGGRRAIATKVHVALDSDGTNIPLSSPNFTEFLLPPAEIVPFGPSAIPVTFDKQNLTELLQNTLKGSWQERAQELSNIDWSVRNESAEQIPSITQDFDFNIVNLIPQETPFPLTEDGSAFSFVPYGLVSQRRIYVVVMSLTASVAIIGNQDLAEDHYASFSMTLLMDESCLLTILDTSAPDFDRSKFLELAGLNGLR